MNFSSFCFIILIVILYVFLENTIGLSLKAAWKDIYLKGNRSWSRYVDDICTYLKASHSHKLSVTDIVRIKQWLLAYHRKGDNI